MRIAQDLKEFTQIIPFDSEELFVLSTYFSSKQDPVRGGYQDSDNFGYIQNWYNSVVRLGLCAVVFYDKLSLDFIKNYQTEKIRFVKVQLGGMSLNDERFFIYDEFIPHLPDTAYVLTTDINDVVINRNPLPLFKSKPHKLFVGRGNRRVWKNGLWTLKALRQFGLKFNMPLSVSFLDYPVFNPGTIGGSKEGVLVLLGKMTEVFEVLGDDRNYDMQVFNWVMKEYYYPKSGRFDGKFPFEFAWYFWFFTYRIQRKLEKNYKKEKYDLSNHQESIEENEMIYAGHPFVSMFSWYEESTEAYLTHK